MKRALKNCDALRFEEFFHGGQTGTFFKIKEMICSKQTAYQRIDIFDTDNAGRVFALDGIIQTIERFEFIYHEMLVHVPMFSPSSPERVLIIGGGDGGTLREVLRHEQVEEAHMCEIDEEVVLAAKEYLPSLSSAMEDERARLFYTAGAEYVSQFQEFFDVILIDSTDPTAGEGGNLFTEGFYTNCKDALTKDGLLVAQTENPVYDTSWLEMAYGRIDMAFPSVKMYKGFSPQYPSGFWTYTMGMKGDKSIAKKRDDNALEKELQYYSSDIHASSFVLPPFLKESLATLKEV